LFEDSAFEVHPLFEREQGLMLAPGNPLGLSGLSDLATKRVRFVNRQKGSGTRSWFDRLLAQAGLKPAAIRGYEIEEFTHQAVAAVVASGAADAGMGVRVAAARFGLAFLPVGRETYYLATRAGEPHPALPQLLEAARRPAAMPGYGPAPAESRGAEPS
jgi:molybdate-binding protein